MIRRERINVLHGVMLHGGGETAVEIGKKLGVPIIVQSHGSDVQTVEEIGYGAPLYPYTLMRVKFAIKNSDKIIALSRLIRNNIIELGGNPDRIFVIPNGFPAEEIQSIPYEDLRAIYNIADDDFLIITSGRNRPVKRIELLFQALSLLKKETKRIKCICIGPPEGLPEMRRILDIEETVILTGQIPQLNKKSFSFPPYPVLINLYRTANLFVSVSYMEAFNASALEALACGTPILITKRQGIRDVIIEGETGFALKDESPEVLANTLLDLMQKKDELARRREYIKNSVSHLTWPNIAKRMREVYLSVIQ